MANFKVKLNVDSDDSGVPAGERWLRMARPFGQWRPTTGEGRFWERYFKQAGPQAAREWVGRRSPPIADLHAKIRKELPAPLKEKLVEKLRIIINLPEADATGAKVGRATRSKDDSEIEAREEREEIKRALETLEIHVESIRGGSLEILLFVLGFAKLLSATGISPDDFAKCLEIATPAAMSVIFGTTVPLEADARMSSGDPKDDTNSGKEKPVMQLPGIQNPSGVSYFIPALVGLAAFGAAMWIFWTISSELAAERKELVSYVSKEADDIGKERIAIGEKLSTVLSAHDAALSEERKDFIGKSAALLAALTKSQVDKDNAAAGSQKALFDAELEFARKVDGASQARETAVIDFVKSRLSPDQKPTPSPPSGIVLSSCEDTYMVKRRIQLALSERGFYAGAIDGKMGAQSAEGLRKFQLQTSLPVTGTVDPATMEKLGLRCETARAG